MIEFEKKIILKEYEHRLLKEKRYPSEKVILQINHYYDTDDSQLNQAGITCRIRERNGSYTATVKDHQKKWKDCSIETSHPVRDLWDDTCFRDMGLRFQGSMKTERTVFVLCSGIKIMLDRNQYLGVTDYELELEYKPRERVRALLEMEAIADCLTFHRGEATAFAFRKRFNQGKNKSQRFFEQRAALDKLVREK